MINLSLQRISRRFYSTEVISRSRQMLRSCQTIRQPHFKVLDRGIPLKLSIRLLAHCTHVLVKKHPCAHIQNQPLYTVFQAIALDLTRRMDLRSQRSKCGVAGSTIRPEYRSNTPDWIGQRPRRSYGQIHACHSLHSCAAIQLDSGLQILLWPRTLPSHGVAIYC